MQRGSLPRARTGILLALLAAGTTNLFTQDQVSVAVRREVGEVRELRLAIPAAEVEIVAGPEGAITVTGSMPMSSWEFWQGESWIRSPANGVYVLQLVGYAPSRVRGRLRISVPPVWRLVHNAGASLRIVAPVSELVSDAYAGTIVAEREAELRHVEIDAFGGAVELRTPELRTLRINGLETSVNVIADRPEFVDITTMSGNLYIHIDELVTGVHRFATTSGLLDFHVDERFDGSLSMQTVEGTIAFPGGGPMNVGAAIFELVYADGAARVTLRTLSGDIRARVTTGQSYSLPHEAAD